MKRLFISADIEGTAGIAAWKETGDDSYFRSQMTEEVAAVCRGALNAGYDEIVIKDAHDTARNLYPDRLPEQAKLIRDWTRNPLCMVAGVAEGFNAAAFTGYHSAGFTGGSPLAHTMSTSLISIELNGEIISEFVISAYTCAYYGVPTVMLSGDTALCDAARSLIPGISFVATQEGIGGAVKALHPGMVCRLIEERTKEALSGDISACLPPLPDSFEIKITYKNAADAYSAGFYPGAKLVSPHSVVYCSADYYEILRFMHFCC